DLLRVWLVGVGQAGAARDGAHLVLGLVAQRKDHAVEHLVPHAEQEVRLILVAVERAQQPRQRPVLGGRGEEACGMARGQRIAAAVDESTPPDIATAMRGRRSLELELAATAAPRLAARTRATTAGKTSSRRSISASVVARPSVMRTAWPA